MKLTLSFKGKPLRFFHLEDGDTIVGRDPACAIHIDSLAVSPQHARLTVRDGRVTLYALPDADPVRVNHQPVTEHDLAEGDEIQVGKHTLSAGPDDQTTFATAADTDDSQARADAAITSGWLQIMNGPHMGRTFPLDKSMTRVGKTGEDAAVITRRNDGYYLSHLEGSQLPSVNGVPIGEHSAKLEDSALIQVGGLELQFFLEPSRNVPKAPAATAAPEAPHRHFSRISFDGDARLRSPHGEWRGNLIDVSMKGALMQRPPGWEAQPGDPYVLELVHDQDHYLVRMEVSVARVSSESVGFHCDHIDIDSIGHLRRLVELNLGDPELLERELTELVEGG